MDKFTGNLAEGLKRFALAGVGAVSLTIEKSREIIDRLAERGEITAAEGQTACEELQKKMSEQLNAFTGKLRAEYENAGFEQLVEKCMALSEEQKAELIHRITAQPADEDGCGEQSCEEPTCEEPACEEPTCEEPACEEPACEEPACEEPACEEPACEEPAEAAPADADPN